MYALYQPFLFCNFFPQRELLKFYLLQALMKLKYSYELRKDNMIYLDKSL